MIDRKNIMPIRFESKDQPFLY